MRRDSSLPREDTRVRFGRTPVAVVNMVALVAAVLVMAVEVGARVPSARVLPAFPGVRAVDLPDLEGRLLPLRSDFVRGLLGDELYEEIFGTPRPGAGDEPRPSRLPPASEPGEAAAPAPGPATIQPGGLSPIVAPGSWVLVADAATDRQTAAPGEEYTYRFTIRNIGRDAFTGDVTLEWHVPFGTTTTDATECTLAGDDVEACRQLPAVPVPGAPSDDVHQGQFETSETIAAGATLVVQARVRVNQTTERGTVLRNHAHMDVVGDANPSVTTNTVDVVVS